MSARIEAAACELRFGQVGIANVRVHRADAEALRTELAQRVRQAPQLFARAAVVLDLSRLPDAADEAATRALLAAVRAAGMLPVGLAYGTRATETLSERLDLPLIAKFRSAYERDDGVAAADAPAAAADHPPERLPPPAAATVPGLHHAKAVRSGQQVYARGRDLVVAAAVANGAEVIADGSIHVYGALRGRALAGALGDESARIYCSEFRAELVSIAGRYRVFEQMPPEFDGQPVHCWLQGDALLIAALDR
ncbi:MAG: septum site-determining protein MinC [Xanthomonadaceae bacterium]|nr:septum site-determining protein MinC [Xanthomonadaceae bacterium]MDE1959234.1 septum site-determining protein MinC [Xanthomonadaceae bacterium]MDE2177116.1 septum site-determining protein MinC [Xanthomonadaceae bacterium]